MNAASSEVNDLIRRACDGDSTALGELLDAHRPYLKIVARRQLDPKIGARLDASDVVQQTCLSVFRRIEQFEGNCEGEFLAWLRTIHENNIRNTIRDQLARKRTVEVEEHHSGVMVENQLDRSPETSPSQRLLLNEDSVQLAAAMQDLPEDQHEAIRLRYLEGWPLARIAGHMDRSFDSVAGLVKRGIVRLRRSMKD